MPVASSVRVRVDGKFFRVGNEKFFPKGVTYGPFALDEDGSTFASPTQTRADFQLVRELGANLIRVYHLPPRWFLDLAHQHGLKVFIDIPWSSHRCFVNLPEVQEEARRAVCEAVQSADGHPAVFAFSVVNEIPSDVVRWCGADEVCEFLSSLVDYAHHLDPGCLCTFGNYPPTEFLRADGADFVCFNVYLHHQRPFENYLSRLQTLAHNKPLLLGETGMDSLRHGEAEKSATLSWQIESVFRGGLAGVILFSFTDDWWRGGGRVEGWEMGLTTRTRQPKESFAAVQRALAQAPAFPLPRAPRVSIVVASYNGARTLRVCLESLQHLNYLDYEVILVDDGSTDDTRAIALSFGAEVLSSPMLPEREPGRRAPLYYLYQPNRGLSVARNTGITAATGEIVAFTDSDCRADEDWLYYLVSALTSGPFIGVGGHNFLPPEDSWVAAAVMVSPGGPAHVMLTDRVAEHIPGCNMAFYRWALEEIGGFDRIYRKAGDDVDVCWRLQQRGYRIGFSPAGFVWHYRRSTVQAYLKQQQGYGEAEALLAAKHPEYFNSIGSSIWRGRIYGAAKAGITLKPPIIYHGHFGAGWFQTLYSPEPALVLMLATTLEFHVLITLPLLIVAAFLPALWPLGVGTLLLSIGVCCAAASQAELPKASRRVWSRPLVALLFFLQPIVRGHARYRGRLGMRTTPEAAYQRLGAARAHDADRDLEEVQYWAQCEMDRLEFVRAVDRTLEAEGWQHRGDQGWSRFDLEIYGTRWSRVQITTALEYLPKGARLLRCRLVSRWSLLASVAFWSLLGLDLLLISALSWITPWIWMILLNLPLFGTFIEQEKRNLQRLIAALLDETAARLKWTTVKRMKPSAA